MPYAEDFVHFGQKEQFKIKMKLKQRKTTWDSPQISCGQLYVFFYCKDNYIANISVGFATTKT